MRTSAPARGPSGSKIAAREARDVDEARRRRDADAELDRLAVEQTRALYGLSPD